MEWDSPWGRGFPGWHIECTAMAAKYLGPYFDIHCGGEDHVPVHHTNEIAQAQACYDTRLAEFWLHGAFLQLDGEKMSKSSGDFLRVESLVERDSTRSPTAFSASGHATAPSSPSPMRASAARLRPSTGCAQPPTLGVRRLNPMTATWPSSKSASRTTSNMPRVLALCWELVADDLPDAAKKATLLHFDQVMGLGLATWTPPTEEVPAAIEALAEQRQQARAAKDWATADALRDEIARGWLRNRRHPPRTPHPPAQNLTERTPMSRILVAECKQEISSFNPVIGTYDNFSVRRGPELTAYHQGRETELTGALQVSADSHVEVIPTYGAVAPSAGL